MALTSIVSGIASLAGSGEGTSGGGSDYSGGIGEKILGAPGDPAGTMANWFNEFFTKKEQKRQFEKEYGLREREVKLREADMRTKMHEWIKKQQWIESFSRGLFTGNKK